MRRAFPTVKRFALLVITLCVLASAIPLSLTSLQYLIDVQVEAAITKNAEVRARNWTRNFLRTTPTAQRMIQTGVASPAELLDLEKSFSLANVIQISLFDKNGIETFSSDPGGFALEPEMNANAIRALESGEQIVLFQEQEEDGGDPYSQETYVEIYLPAMMGGEESVGTIGIFVDVSEYQRAQRTVFRKISIALIAGTALVLMIPVSAFIFRTRQLRQKDRRLLELMRYDQLTGALNRNSLSKWLEDHFADRKRPAATGVLFVDVDYFKQINDRYGHACGDRLLQHVASIVSSGLRSSADVIGRYGGDEFVVVLPATDAEGLAKAAARILAGTRVPCTHDSRSHSVSLSIGAYLATGSDDLKKAFQRADLAVYTAKKRGRGQIAVFDPSLEAESVPLAAAPEPTHKRAG